MVACARACQASSASASAWARPLSALAWPTGSLDLPEEGERPLTVLDGGFWLVLSAAHRPEADQRLGLTRLVTGVAESGQALTQEVLGQPQISLVEPDLTEAGQRERLCDAGSELPAEVSRALESASGLVMLPEPELDEAEVSQRPGLPELVARGAIERRAPRFWLAMASRSARPCREVRFPGCRARRPDQVRFSISV